MAQALFALILGFVVVQSCLAQPGSPLNEPIPESIESDLDALQRPRFPVASQMLAASYVPAEYFMPPPADPSLLLRDETTGATNLGAGTRLGSGILFRAAATGRVQAWYDDGLIGSGPTHVLSTIAPPGSSAARRAGYFDLANADGALTVDIQTPAEEIAQAQAYLDTQILDNELDVRQAFLRVNNVLAGKYWTTWGDEGALPRSILTNTSAAGTVYAPGIPQIRIAIPRGCWGTTFAIQQPLRDDFALVDPPPSTAVPGDVRLQRYPDFAARLRYFDGDYNSLSIGGIVRRFGREDIARNEDFVTGWGISAAVRSRIGCCTALQLGGFLGEGVAGSTFGLLGTEAAAGPTGPLALGGELTLLSNYGAYAGLQRRWTADCQSNFAYGFVQSELSPITAANAARTGHNAWANVIRKINDFFAVGLEYHYGQFEVADGTTADNHRLHFVLQLTTSPPENSQQSAERIVRSYATQSGITDRRTLSEVRESVPSSSGRSRFSRL